MCQTTASNPWKKSTKLQHKAKVNYHLLGVHCVLYLLHKQQEPCHNKPEGNILKDLTSQIIYVSVFNFAYSLKKTMCKKTSKIDHLTQQSEPFLDNYVGLIFWSATHFKDYI